MNADTTSSAPVSAAPVESAAPSNEGMTEANSKSGSPATSPDGKTAGEKAKDEAIRRMKLKIDGVEQEMDESEVIRLAQMGKSSHQRYQEAAQARKEAEQFLTMLQNDPISVLENPKLGLNFRKIAEEYVWKQLQEEAMSPQEKAQAEKDRIIAEYRRKEQEQQAQEASQKDTQLRQKYAADFDKKIGDALNTSGLPKTTWTVNRMIDYMSRAIEAGYELEPSDLVEQIRKDYVDEHKALYGQTDGDKLLELLGEDVAKKIRESDIKRLKSTQSNGFQSKPGETKQPSQTEKPKKLAGKEWRDQLMEEALGKKVVK